MRCLVRIEKRLPKEPKTAQNYVEFMNKLFQVSQAVILKSNEITGTKKKVRYQCHHCVHTSGIVFDCTGHYKL